MFAVVFGVLGYFRRSFADPNDIVVNTTAPDRDPKEAAFYAVSGFLLVIVFELFFSQKRPSRPLGTDKNNSQNPPEKR